MTEYIINLSNSKEVIDKIKVSEAFISNNINLKKLFTNNFSSGKFVKEITINTNIEKIIPSILKDVIILKKENGDFNLYINENYTRLFDVIYVLDFIGFNDYLELIKMELPEIIKDNDKLSLILNTDVQELNSQYGSIYSWKNSTL